MTLSQQLRTLADKVEDDATDDVEQAHLSFRCDEELARESDLVGQVDDPHQGTVLATIFTED